RFGKNAKLYLVYATMSGVNSSIFIVAFAFYLEEIFRPSVSIFGLRLGIFAFIGLALSAQAIAHGVNALPSGLIGDKYGRKRSFIAASLVAVLAGAAILVTADPIYLLVLAMVVGIGEAFHGVVGAPFMMENSREEERMHLFTLSGILTTVSTVVGAFLGGLLPIVFQGWIAGIDPAVLGPFAFGTDRAIALRLTLFMAVPIGLAELVPLAIMRESYARVKVSLRDMFLLRHVRSKGTIRKLSAISIGYAAGLGLYFPLLNLHFEHSYDINAAEFGPIVALNNIAIAAAILAVPLLVRRWGKVRTIVYTRLLAIPFLASLALAPSLFLAVFFFVMRGAFSSMAYPVTGAFSMEVVNEPERATTAGFTHAAFDLFFGGSIFAAGILLELGGFWIAFLVGGSLYFGHAMLWYQWFSNHPIDVASRVPGVTRGSA
ncbi:MAG: MFS transporter, partial [Thermoplasmata archaeon]